MPILLLFGALWAIRSACMSSLIQSQPHHSIIWKYILIFSTFLYPIVVARRLNSNLRHVAPPCVLIFSDFCFWARLLSPFKVDTNSGTPKLELILGSQGFRCAPINRPPCQNHPITVVVGDVWRHVTAVVGTAYPAPFCIDRFFCRTDHITNRHGL